MRFAAVPIVAALFCVSCGSKKPSEPAGVADGTNEVTVVNRPELEGPPVAKLPSGEWELRAFVLNEAAEPDPERIRAFELEIEKIRALLAKANLTQPGYQAERAKIAAFEDKLAMERGLREVLPHAVPTIRFGPGTRVSGTGGCNVWNGQLEQDEDGTTRIGPIATTQKACDPTTDEQEVAFLAALGETQSIKSLGDEVQLVAADMSYLSFLPAAPKRRP